ncbi:MULTISPECIES: VOC family protein [Paenibacillus]|uniref:VOC family protein n=1 Tax=Paenibacillus TaxID=44249 RepID=UPI0022B86ABC|nr:VOC family protein [Paenibacillus caseinilyticus]MCZ8521167.1 VOC family protein [Paenibacillus caseinilyticus]
MITLLTPFILLDGQAKEAITFYQSALGAELLFVQTFGESPDTFDPPLTEEAKQRVAHSVLKVGEAELYVADRLPEEPSRPGNSVSICLTTTDAEQAQMLYEALQRNGRVDAPLQEVHFSPAYGIVTDAFGITFQLFTKRKQ